MQDGIEVRGAVAGGRAEVLTDEALGFVASLQREFGRRREELLAARIERQAQIDGGELPLFAESTRSVREDPSWRVAPLAPGLEDRRVEITGPVDRKMMINALNSGAKVFMADFEDSNVPTWENVLQGQVNLRDAVDGTIRHDDPVTGRQYALADQVATLMVRPRGWHLDEG